MTPGRGVIMPIDISERDAVRSAVRLVREEYHEEGDRIYRQFEAVDWYGKRPDAILIFEWCRGKWWMVHTIEAKRDSGTLITSDWRHVVPVVAQARSYRGNYRWLAVTAYAWEELDHWARFKVKKDCRRQKHNLGLIVCWKTKAEMLIESGYWPGFQLDYFKDAEWYIERLSQ